MMGMKRGKTTNERNQMQKTGKKNAGDQTTRSQ
jgi:hypothetical protein